MRRFKSDRAAKIILVALLPLLLSGGACVTASVGMATSNIPLEGKEYRVLGAAETMVEWWNVDLGIVGIPLQTPPVDDAVRELLRQKGGNALINIRYSTDKWVFLFIISRYRFHIQADVVKVTGRRKREGE